MLLALAIAATFQLAVPSDADLQAPADRWTTFGGSAARTGASASTPLRGPVAVAWTHDAKAKIVGEPLVWEERIVLELESGTNRRSLRFLDLLTGEALTSRDTSATSAMTLEPSLWRNEVLYRKSPTSLGGLRMWRGRMYERWSHRTEGEVGPPLLEGREVYACVGDGVERMTWGKSAPVWRIEGNYRGRVSLTADSVFALRQDRNFLLFCVEIDRQSGRVLREALVGRPSKLWTHGETSSATISLLGDCWGVYAPPPLSLIAGQRRNGLIYDPWDKKVDEELAQIPDGGTWLSPLALRIEPNGVFGWVGAFASGGSFLKRSSNLRQPELVLLATEKSNAEFALHRAGATVLPGVTYVGPRAYDRYSKDVLWREEAKDVECSRAIPARDTVLYVRGGTELVALRSAFRILAESTSEESTPQDRELPASGTGQLWLRDGSSREAEFATEEGSARLSWKEKPEDEPEWLEREDVLSILSADGGVVWAKDGRSLTRTFRTRGDERRAEWLADLAFLVNFQPG
ncbi:MAG: PQQ-binding-like beta-propeller repeat protein, partial [Planctomycetota bacterium]